VSTRRRFVLQMAAATLTVAAARQTVALAGPPSAPRVNHCSGGGGADAADFLGSLEAWVGQGRPADLTRSVHVAQSSRTLAYPTRLLPSDPTAVEFSRPHPRTHGDPKDAASFSPVPRP
jgi:hypothetical protein